MRITILCLIVLFNSLFVHAQIRAFGFKAGANRSTISNLSTIILSEPYFINYSMKESSRNGFHLGIFYEYKLENELWGFQSELLYAQQGGNVEFNNYEKDFNYKMEFAYQYLNIAVLAKWFPWHGPVSLGAGPFLGINVAPNNIKYKSWGAGKEPAFGSDLQQQQQLRNVLTGKHNFGLAMDLGYDINNWIKVGGRYYYSATNAVETQANSYNFISVKNTNTVWELSVAVNVESLFNTD